MTLHHRPEPVRRKAQFNFLGYGNAMLWIALICGLILCRGWFGCFGDVVLGYNIGGVSDDASSTGLVDDKGGVKSGTKGSYVDSVHGGAGFFGTMFYGAEACVERETFRDPKPVFYAFGILLALGLLFRVFDRFQNNAPR